MTAYQYYQIVITQTAENRYAAINTLSLFDENGVDLCRQNGVQITADKQYRNQEATYMIDGTDETYWEGAESERQLPIIITVSLPKAQMVSSLFITNNTMYDGETVTQFTLNGSNDKQSWVHIKDFENTESSRQKYYYLVMYGVNGVSLQDNGQASRFILVHNWRTGEFLDKITPKANGDWTYLNPSKEPLLITHVGEDGFAPQADGGIIPIMVE